MEHSIFLDSEKINSIRESLDEKFNRIEVIDDSVTPKIIQWLEDFFSFLENSNNGFFISNKNIELERWAYYLIESKPYLFDFTGNVKELLTDEEYENFMIYVSYCEIKDNLHKENEILQEAIINDFYLVKLPLLEPILSSVIKGISIKLNNSNNHKKHFEDLKTHIEEFYFKGIGDKSTEKKNKQTTPIIPDSHPFHNDDVRDFYLYLESKYTISKSYHSAFYKFFTKEGLIDLKEENRIRQSFFNWINERYNLQGDDKIVKLQTNLENFNLEDFEKHLTAFEESKGLNFYFHDFRDGGINRPKKKPTSKN
jgi:hypothetical protein